MIADQLRAIRERIDAAARRSGRDPQHVQLLAVSKTFPAEAVLEAAAAGQRRFAHCRAARLYRARTNTFIQALLKRSTILTSKVAERARVRAQSRSSLIRSS